MKSRIFGNALWIIIMQCIKALITLGVSMLTTRFLGPSNYGLINYAASIVSFVAPIMFLGYNNTLVRELVQQPEKEGEILGTAITSSLFSSFACIGLVLAFVAFANSNEKETLLVCGLYSTILIFQSVDLILYWFQAKLISKYFSITSVCAYVVVAIYKTCILLLGKDVYWFAISSTVEYMLVSFALLFAYKRLGGQKLRFSFSRMKTMLHTSRYYIVASVMVSVSAYIDRIMIKLMIGDAANGYYSAAVTCAAMLTFVFVAIIDSFRPEIIGCKNEKPEKYQYMVKLLYTIITYLSIAQCAVFFCLADPIIKIICGDNYAAAVPLLRVVVWYTPFSYLAAARNIWILAEHKERYLWIVNLTSAAVNIISNFVMIPVWGAMGAAVASLLSNFIVVVVMTYLIKPFRENYRLLVQSLEPVFLIESVNGIITRVRKNDARKRG